MKLGPPPPHVNPAPRVPLALAVLCLNTPCAMVFNIAARVCPACGSAHFMPLATWLR